MGRSVLDPWMSGEGAQHSRCLGNLCRGRCCPEAVQHSEYPGQCWCSGSHRGQRSGAESPLSLTAGRGPCGSEPLRLWDKEKANGCQRPSSNSPGRKPLAVRDPIVSCLVMST